ncbi:hypothetical protein ODJ79_10955 [Actinoplanes sp. KI2]|uniref:hypothetical protein n=1 Tax=Actinoplanes sp. KI2 TaxID=2983315 RepID=UPI0021D5E73D|nr:hypothetical protein [Actinoplanes sp. KI2]MCU7724234.1 hypothetical protein [Actinoplanes sp. KI2]
MEYRTQFQAIHKRPQLYGLDGSYGQYCAYLAGLDAGNDGRLLTGFREWLVTRLGDGNNLTWQGLVIHLARPDGAAGGRAAVESADRDPAVIDTLFALLDEFFALRVGPPDLVRIYDDYLTWLKAQSWYQPT